ncbi:hypothetical protein F5884DRAFT_850748 [Xylogone sp. PMI_703]|nr:hypothetical protein F5884DRAFT_850748 [Xylogone sp. PMI_703]
MRFHLLFCSSAYPNSFPLNPEPRSAGGLASVFKSLTGKGSVKSSNPSSPAAVSNIHVAQQLNTIAPKNAIYGGPPNFDQLYEQLKPERPLSERLTAAQSLRYVILDYPLSDVANIWYAAKDLIEPAKPAEARVAGFELLTACVQHGEPADLERLEYFKTLTAPANPEDFHLQLAAVVELAKHGKDLSGFHYYAIPLLTRWLRESFTTTSAARKHAGRQTRVTKGKAPLGEETNFGLLFAFIIDVIKFSFNVSSEETTGNLIDVVLYICTHTPLSSDLKACIGVIDAIVTYGEIPSDKLLECVKVLCSIHCLVEDVQLEAWRTISNLCKSHNGQNVVRILLDILQDPRSEGASEKQTVRDVRGALSVLEKLFAQDGKDGYPVVPFALLMDGLSKVLVVDHPKVETDILRLVLSFFSEEEHDLNENVMEEDWSVMFDVVSKCAYRASDTSNGRVMTARSQMGSNGLIKEDPSEQTVVTGIAQLLYNIIVRIEELLNRTPPGELFQRDDCIKFFVDVHCHLPESCAKLVIDYYMDYRFCYPSDSEWKQNIAVILESFFEDRSQPTHIRLHALKAATDVFEVVDMVDDHEDADAIRDFITSILDDIRQEKDILVLQEVIAFTIVATESADETLFNYIIQAIRESVMDDRIQSPVGSPSSSRQGLMNRTWSISSSIPHITQTPTNVVTKGLIQIFINQMDKSAFKAVRVYNEIIWIAKSHSCEIDARISAMKLLFRLRADWANRIYLTPFTESEGLAASLYRTPASLARKQAADEASHQTRQQRADDNNTSRISRTTSFGGGYRTPQRSSSGVQRTLQRSHQTWMLPDSDALPGLTSDKASTVLVSYEDPEDTSASTTSNKTVIDIATYLETIIGLLENGCDWEVYSFILVHLASQLSNQALFRNAISQIQFLREVLCEEIKSNSFHEPPTSSGLRKADVAICLFQILTMVMSYHQHFKKHEEDDIVRTFLQGVGTWERVAKSCIHALSICCHELPVSTSKALVTILQKMSQIITQSHVAVHILEFLACLARMPNLYVNFREEEYRIVFAICFRYLQYVRDQAGKDTNRLSYSRNSGASGDSSRGMLDSTAESNFQPNTSDDLPQYVYALAYHVITFWFLALKLPDRASQVSWIAKNLVLLDATGRERIDEQAQVTLDFMQRVAYADVDESASDLDFASEHLGQILKKRWIIGQSLVTIEQATNSGWAQITKRQPSGTSCYIIREKFTRPPAHQSQFLEDGTRDPRHSEVNVVLPSHLLLQLSASIPQSTDRLRPIPLPDDDAIRRAVASLDRNFTVDGHKVGVIYIGENQTDEVEILANVMGSSDYTDFLTRLGTLTRLKGAKFNTQGLDREYDSDGEYAFCWRDRVTEIVFHVTTQMPTNLEHDPQCINKKRHIGNDFVNIIFNNSGLPFRFDTFPSDFNYVNIVITPESRESFVATRLRTGSHSPNTFYKVQVMSKPGFPEISPAAETKIMSLKSLPGFIRLLALNASVFSLVWYNREGGEHISSWRNRLREINRLREKYGPKPSSSISTSSPPGTSNSGADARNAAAARETSKILIARLYYQQQKQKLELPVKKVSWILWTFRGGHEHY